MNDTLLIALMQEYLSASCERQDEIRAEIEEKTPFHCYVDDSNDLCLYIYRTGAEA